MIGQGVGGSGAIVIKLQDSSYLVNVVVYLVDRCAYINPVDRVHLLFEQLFNMDLLKR